ncbi:hypothetical protein D3C85_1346650 [compost metagenome]
MFTARLIQQASDLFWIDIQRKNHFKCCHALRASAQGNVAQVLRNQLRVRDDDDRAITELYLRRPHVDSPNIPFNPAYTDQVTHFDRALGKQDQTGDKILDDLLQAKANAH